MPSDLEREIEHAINRASAENESNTPDYILAQYLGGCLAAFNAAVQQRETWYGRDARPSMPFTPLEHHQSWPIKLRLWLLIPGSHRWNKWIRDCTAWLEGRI